MDAWQYRAWGTIALRPDDVEAKELMKACYRAFTAAFVTVKSYSIGRAAQKLLGTGVRFTTDIRSPTEFDLSSI